MSRPLLASELYALSQNGICSGSNECHWCGGPCSSNFPHDDPPPIIGIKARSPCKRPANSYICNGCWLFKRKRITISYLGGGYKDGQCPSFYSWWITEKGAWAITNEDKEELYECLLDPPSKFVLALLDGKSENYLQLAEINNHQDKILGSTPLVFTINNITHYYNVYELTEALINGPDGKEPGVGALLRLLGPYNVNEQVEKKGRGRPPLKEERKPYKGVRKGL